MTKVVFAVGGLLIVLGVGVYAALLGGGAEKVSATALIPAFVGLPIVLFGLLALKDGWRAFAMHVIVVIAMLGFLASAGRLVSGLISGGGTAIAKFSLVGMALLCGYLVFACVQSFRAARKRRVEEEAAAAAD